MCKNCMYWTSKNKGLVRFLYIAMAAMALGWMIPTTANASYPILKLDIGNNNSAAQTEPGFTSFTIADSGKVVDGIRIQLAGTLDARFRGAPTGIPYELIYRDFIFSRPGGMTVTLSGLNPNETYEITIYAFDTSSGSGGDRIADWLANGDFLLTAGFSTSAPPVDANSNAHSGLATADGTGTIVLEATANPGTAEILGASNPFGFLNALVVSSLTPLTTARHPVPANGATVTSTAVELQWERGMLSKSSNVYFGEDRDRVANATTADPEFRGNTTNASSSVGSAGNPYPDGLVPNTTYYWRIDEVNDLRSDGLWGGELWSFTVAALTATDPDPISSSLFADPNAVLTWTAGAGTVRHHVYFGSNLQDVQAGTGGTDKGEVTDPCYPTGMLDLNKTYYWRMDEIDATTTHAGEVWSFTTSRQGMGTITMDLWESVSGDHTLVNLLNDTRYPDSPTRSEALTEFGTVDGVADNYGAQISGWLYCPVTGEYTFLLSSAGQGELWLSTDDDPVNIVLLASQQTWGSYDSFSLKSVSVSLVAGEKYYIMARWKDFASWDHCQVAWQGAGVPAQQIIAGHFLSPFMPVTAYGPSPAKDATEIERTRILRWKSGVAATSHRIYFGTDPNAVRDAGTSSPELKGTQPKGTETYNPGTLAFETTYYWRIDEVNNANPASPWVGDVWSFKVGNFLVLDDFESYTDVEGERVYQTWIDGWGTENNGSTVGYLYPDILANEHYAETAIIRNGRQSMPFFYDNDKKYSEAVRSLVGVDRDWTREGVDALSVAFRGYAGTVGILVEDPNAKGTYTMRGSGTDITGAADEFHFAYKKLTGAGSIVAQVLSVSNTDVFAQAGVMIRETLEPGSKHALASVTPGSGVASEGRIDTGGGSFRYNQTGITAPHWVKLERSLAGEFTVTHSADGITWVPLEGVESQWIWMDAPTVYIGLAVTSHSANATCEAMFSNITMTGDISPEPWEHHDVGIMSNDPEPMYVVLNGTTVVYNEDPNAILTNQWIEWRIDLKQFADQGVSLTNIDSLGIGVGTWGDTTVKGGTGTLYFDDIRLYRPAPAANP